MLPIATACFGQLVIALDAGGHLVALAVMWNASHDSGAVGETRAEDQLLMARSMIERVTSARKDLAKSYQGKRWNGRVADLRRLRHEQLYGRRTK